VSDRLADATINNDEMSGVTEVEQVPHVVGWSVVVCQRLAGLRSCTVDMHQVEWLTWLLSIQKYIL